MRKLNNYTDKDLILAYNKGNQKALNVLVKRWHLKFCNLAFWILNDADLAKDIAQESWTIIIDKLKTLKEPEKFKSWAISIVNRKSIDWIRTNNREKKKLITHYNESEKVILYPEIVNNSSIIKILLKSIEKLSVEHQMVIRLFYKESYSLKEISEILSISIGTTKSRLFHAREKLKTILKYNNYER